MFNEAISPVPGIQWSPTATAYRLPSQVGQGVPGVDAFDFTNKPHAITTNVQFTGWQPLDVAAADVSETLTNERFYGLSADAQFDPGFADDLVFSADGLLISDLAELGQAHDQAAEHAIDYAVVYPATYDDLAETWHVVGMIGADNDYGFDTMPTVFTADGISIELAAMDLTTGQISDFSFF
jgi:hypothetical protein